MEHLSRQNGGSGNALHGTARFSGRSPVKALLTLTHRTQGSRSHGHTLGAAASFWTMPALSSSAPSEGLTQSDEVARGRQIATKGSAEGAPPCASCHAENGAADGSGAFPRLTGQLTSYLKKQLDDFADRTRADPVMSPIAKRLSDKEKNDVAAFYSSQQAPYFPRTFVEQPVLELGGALAAAGRPDQGIPACFSCHGQSGRGMVPNFPYLAGQYWSYLAAQLQDFRTGTRRNDAGGAMRLIASKLREAERQAVSAYFASVRPPCSCDGAPADSRSAR